MKSFCVMLWANEGCADDLARFEDSVLRLVEEHAGAVVCRVRNRDPNGQPNEVQVLRFADSEALDGYLRDPRRAAMLDERDRVVARTETIDVEILS